MDSNSCSGLALFIILTAVCQFGSLALAADSTRCERTQISQTPEAQRVDIKIGDRTISLLGWQHQDVSLEEDDANFKLWNAARSAAEGGSCAIAVRNLKTLIDGKPAKIRSGFELLTELIKIRTQRQVNVLAVEHSPQSWNQRLQHLVSEAEALESIKAKCSTEAETLTVTSQAATLYPGPEYLFMRAFARDVSVAPVEDESYRSEASPLARTLAITPEFFKDLTLAAKQAINEINKRVHDGATAIEDAEIGDVVAKQGQDEVAAKLREHLKSYQQLISISPKRNTKMADSILAGRGNYVFPVGYSHVPDLAAKLYSRCLKGEG